MSRSKTPYLDQPDRAFWKKAVSRVQPSDIDPVANFNLVIDKSTKIATAGSCFAQHIARKLVSHRYNYYVAEPPHPLMSKQVAKEYNYGTFSARYGNIYTSRQLKQLLERAYGNFNPVENEWFEEKSSAWLDPFRPAVQPGGFSSHAELILDRNKHFAAIRKLMETLDVFVFTLGLTECWINVDDGAAFPVCPGVSGGKYDIHKHVLLNLTVDDVVADIRFFLSRLRDVNPNASVILTVSPVPLIATAGNDHVLSATTYSKSVLRVAAEILSKSESNVHYFPSYEIITSAASRGSYFASDCREVTESGVNHVMRLFFRHVTGGLDLPDPVELPDSLAPNAQPIDAIQQVVDTICDEQLIEAHVNID